MTRGYHYTGCGLDFVYLASGYTHHETPYGRGVSIEDADGLHKAIAMEIVNGSWRLRGQEVRFLRAELDLSQEGLARVLKTSRATIARYEGQPDKDLPGQSDTALRLFYAGAVGGDRIVSKIVDLLKETDEIENCDVIFEETMHGWMRIAA